MRINRYVALCTGISRRQADKLIAGQTVTVNGQPAQSGQDILPADIVAVDGSAVQIPKLTTIALNKPAGYVCSRDGQGSQTVYDLLPSDLHQLKPIGRLDKDSSGLLLLTNDGDLAQNLSHPKHAKQKQYEISLNKPLKQLDFDKITQSGVDIGDERPSILRLDPASQDRSSWLITMSEGRNRQIRRTFEALGYRVTRLHRTAFGPHRVASIPPGKYSVLTADIQPEQ